mgnify:CR=1 FL=1
MPVFQNKERRKAVERGCKRNTDCLLWFPKAAKDGLGNKCGLVYGEKGEKDNENADADAKNSRSLGTTFTIGVCFTAIQQLGCGQRTSKPSKKVLEGASYWQQF